MPQILSADDVVSVTPSVPAPAPVSQNQTSSASGDWFSENAPNVSAKTSPKRDPRETTISAKPKTFADRLKAPFTGEGSAYGTIQAQREGQKWATGQDANAKPLIDLEGAHAEDAVSSKVGKGIVKGVASTISGFTTPEGIELQAATGGLLEVPAVARLISAGFGLAQVKGAIERSPELKKQLAANDTEGATKTLTEMGLQLGMGAGALKHASKKAKAESESNVVKQPTSDLSVNGEKPYFFGKPVAAPTITPPFAAAPPPAESPKTATKPPMWKKAKEQNANPPSQPVTETPATVEAPAAVPPVENPPAPVEQPPTEQPTPVQPPVDDRPAEGARPWEHSDPVPPERVPVLMKTSEINADPKRFQYKADAIGKGGTTDEFRSVTHWDPSSAGNLQVWRDPADGKVYVTNGHHRLEMANRLGVDEIPVQFIDAPDATAARIRGALTNIRDGKGTSIDAAKIFRDGGITPEEMAREGISPEGKVSKEGIALSGLSDRAFQKVVDGSLLPAHGAVIGEKLRGQTATQDSMIDWLKKQKVRYNANEIGDIAEQWKRFEENGPASVREDNPQGSMFDEDVAQKNYFGEKAQIQEEIRSKLRGDKKLFGLLGKQTVADKLEGAGKNVIDAEGNQGVATKAAQILEVYSKLVNKAGGMENIITDAARKVAEGMSVSDATADAYPRISAEIERILNPSAKNAHVVAKEPAGAGRSGTRIQPEAPIKEVAPVQEPAPEAKKRAKAPRPEPAPAVEPAPAPEAPARKPFPVAEDPFAAPRRGARKIQGKQAESQDAPAPAEAPVSEEPIKPRTGPRKLGKRTTEPEAEGKSGTELSRIDAGQGDSQDNSPIQAAKNSAGRVKIGADVKALAEELGSSLYKGDDVQVITKELMQNAFDAIRGTKNGEVEVRLDRYGKTITIKDNGKGMSRKDLETVFVDLGSSGKRNEAGASGGFGLAKAAPLMMSDSILVETVNEKGGKRYRSTMTTNKNELLGEGANIQTEEVPNTVPTGTTITSNIGHTDWGKWSSAQQFAQDSLKSINAPGKAKIFVDGSDVTSDKYTTEMLKLNERKNLKPIHSFTTSGANVKMYSAPGQKGTIQSMGSIPVEVNNHGIYQFNNSIYLGQSAQMEGVPAILAIDVQAIVPEGHKDYPFTANREEMRGEIDDQVRKYVEENIVKPAQTQATEFISKKYNSLPTVGKDFDSVIFDSGQRLDEHELSKLQNNADFVNLSDEIAQVLDDSLVHLEGADLGVYTGLGGKIERAGIVFAKELHGVHITDPKTGRATVFINPFTANEGSSPRKAASLTWHTIKHEILHDKITGHNEGFTSGLVKLDEALGEYTEAIGRLIHAYADPTDPTKFRKGLIDAKKLYTESRDRTEREKDIFKGQSSRRSEGNGKPVPKTDESNRGSGDQRGPVRSAGGGSGDTKPNGVVRSSQTVPDGGKNTVRGTGRTESRGAGSNGRPNATKPPTWLKPKA